MLSHGSWCEKHLSACPLHARKNCRSEMVIKREECLYTVGRNKFPNWMWCESPFLKLVPDWYMFQDHDTLSRHVTDIEWQVHSGYVTSLQHEFPEPLEFSVISQSCGFLNNCFKLRSKVPSLKKLPSWYMHLSTAIFSSKHRNQKIQCVVEKN